MDTHNNTRTTRREYLCTFRFLMLRSHFTVNLGPITQKEWTSGKEGVVSGVGGTVLFVCTADPVNSVNEAFRLWHLRVRHKSQSSYTRGLPGFLNGV